MRKYIILLFIFLSGCSLLPKPAAVHDFGLPAVNPAVNRPARQPAVVSIEAPKWLYDNRIRYRLLYASPTQVRFYSLDRWLAPPPDLFEQLLTDSSLQSRQPLTIQFLEFEQQFTAQNQAKVLMSFTVSLNPANNAPAATSQAFNLQLPCPSPDAKGAVSAFSSLTKEAVTRINTWLAEQEK